MFTIVTLTENALTAHDVDRIAHLHDPEAVRVHLVVPVNPQHNRLVEALDDVALGRLGRAVRGDDTPPEQAELAAREALEVSVAALHEAGVEADGELLQGEPAAAVVAVVHRLGADEVIVVTEPHLVEESLRRDWASRLRDDLDKPVLHVVAGTDRVVG